MTSNISSESDLITWTSSGNTGILTQNITLTTGQSYPYNLADNSILNGNGYTITLASDITTGIFSVTNSNYTVQIKNTLFDADAITSIQVDGLGHSMLFAHVNPNATLTGISITITNCGCIGSFSLEASCGTFIGNSWNTSGGTTIITGCYSTATMSGDHSGGIAGPNQCRNNSKVVITECYTTGEISGQYSGGIVASGFGRDNLTSGNAEIKNCYSLGTISGQFSGGICGWNLGINDGIFVIGNCYSFGEVTGPNTGGISGTDVDGTNGTVEYCYSKHASSTGTASGAFFASSSAAITASNSKAGNGTWDSILNTDLQDNYNGNTNVWITDNSFTSGFGLTTFNQSPWDVDTSYITNSSEAQFGSAGGSGDPHITTVNLESYDLVTNGFFNLFDNRSRDRLIINAQISKPKFPIWRNKEYISLIYISHNDNICLIHPGFRGEAAKIIFNNLEKTDLNEKKLDLDDNHKKFCGECKYRTRNNNLLMRHRRGTGHRVLAGIRNKISINIKTDENEYMINIQNVDQDNFNPAEIIIKPFSTSKKHIYSGAIVEVSEPYSTDIPYITYKSSLSNHISI